MTIRTQTTSAALFAAVLVGGGVASAQSQFGPGFGLPPSPTSGPRVSLPSPVPPGHGGHGGGHGGHGGGQGHWPGDWDGHNGGGHGGNNMDDWWWRRGWRGVVTTGSGLSVNGRYDGDKWKLNLHLGSSALGEKLLWGRQSPVVCRPTTRWPYFSFNDGWYDSGWAWTTYGWRWYNSSDYSIDAYPPGYVDPALTGQQTVPPAAAAAAQANQNQAQADQPAAEPEPGPLARGIVALYLEQAEEAVSAFRDYVKAEPTDHQAKRLYAMALVENKEFDDAVSMMSLAYRQDPGLAGQPIDAESLGLEDSRIRNMLTKIVAFGHRSDRASAWLTAAVLMQAEGRQKQALAMVEKARKAGLDAEVADPLSAELKRK